MPDVHPTAVVHPSAQLEDDVSIGPYCVVGPQVMIGAGSQLLSHVVVEGPTHLGAHNVVHPFAVLGSDPQHRGYAGEPTRLVIGDHNVIREHVTIHRGTAVGASVTVVGSHCLLMVGSHVAHDAMVGSHVTLTNGTLLGGHVEFGDWAVAAGHVAVAPFTRIGESAFLAGNAMVERDVPPFMMAAGDRATLRAINRVGLERREVPASSVTNLRAAFHALFPLDRCGIAHQGMEAAEMEKDPFVCLLLQFLRATSHQGVMPRNRSRSRTQTPTEMRT